MYSCHGTGHLIQDIHVRQQLQAYLRPITKELQRQNVYDNIWVTQAMAYSVDNDALPQARHYQLERSPSLAPPHRSYALIEISIINILEGAIYCKWGLPRGFGLTRGNYGGNKKLHHTVIDYKKEKTTLVDSYFERNGWNDPTSTASTSDFLDHGDMPYIEAFKTRMIYSSTLKIPELSTIKGISSGHDVRLGRKFVISSGAAFLWMCLWLTLQREQKEFQNAIFDAIRTMSAVGSSEYFSYCPNHNIALQGRPQLVEGRTVQKTITDKKDLPFRTSHIPYLVEFQYSFRRIPGKTCAASNLFRDDHIYAKLNMAGYSLCQGDPPSYVGMQGGDAQAEADPSEWNRVTNLSRYSLHGAASNTSWTIGGPIRDPEEEEYRSNHGLLVQLQTPTQIIAPVKARELVRTKKNDRNQYDARICPCWLFSIDFRRSHHAFRMSHDKSVHFIQEEPGYYGSKRTAATLASNEDQPLADLGRVSNSAGGESAEIHSLRKPCKTYQGGPVRLQDEAARTSVE
ncbi:hypothetical protein J6590_083969 [Homalodisca vitripennis]|nr:hypothetical protein J6590_083969 [Homalodisca vitripennis]